MALAAYLAATQALLQNPPAPTTLYTTAQLTGWINTARGQIAGEAQCVRVDATLPVTAAGIVYPFSSIVLGDAAVAGVINVQTVWRQAGGGRVWMTPRPFPWFSLYELNNPGTTPPGAPTRWAQFGQGASGPVTQGGSLYIAPLPDSPYTLAVDTVCYPVPLVDDTTPECIPFLWTDCICYFAAYLALLSAQSPARMADALRYFQVFEEFMGRARRAATPGVLPTQYPQTPDPTMGNKLGMGAAKGAA